MKIVNILFITFITLTVTYCSSMEILNEVEENPISILELLLQGFATFDLEDLNHSPNLSEEE